jgi:F420-dependent methylenetetrahydromethanopterin dehydrogenase
MGMPSRDEIAWLLREQGRLLRLGPLAPTEEWALLRDDLDRLDEHIRESDAIALTDLVVHQAVAQEARHRAHALAAAEGLAGFAVGGGL